MRFASDIVSDIESFLLEKKESPSVKIRDDVKSSVVSLNKLVKRFEKLEGLADDIARECTKISGASDYEVAFRRSNIKGLMVKWNDQASNRGIYDHFREARESFDKVAATMKLKNKSKARTKRVASAPGKMSDKELFDSISKIASNVNSNIHRLADEATWLKNKGVDIVNGLKKSEDMHSEVLSWVEAFREINHTVSGVMFGMFGGINKRLKEVSKRFSPKDTGLFESSGDPWFESLIAQIQQDYDLKWDDETIEEEHTDSSSEKKTCIALLRGARNSAMESVNDDFLSDSIMDIQEGIRRSTNLGISDVADVSSYVELVLALKEARESHRKVRNILDKRTTGRHTK